jgi:Flp pilus assembly protein TadG
MRRWKKKGRGEEGQTLVEFALVAPVLLLILFGIVQYGIAFKNSIVVTDAVRAGARQAAVSRGLAPSLRTAAVTQAVDASAGNLDPTKLIVTVTSPTWTAGDQVTVTATYPYSINILGVVVTSGDLKSTTVERVE